MTLILTGIILSIDIGVFLDEELAKIDALHRVNEARPSVNVRFVDICTVLHQILYNLKEIEMTLISICLNLHLKICS